MFKRDPIYEIVVSRAGLVVPPDRLCPRCKMEETVDYVHARGSRPQRAMLGLACLEEWRAIEKQYARGWRPTPDGSNPFATSSPTTGDGTSQDDFSDALAYMMASMMGGSAFHVGMDFGGEFAREGRRTIFTWERKKKS